MSNIDKRALREAAVRAGGVKWQYMRATQHTKAYLTDEKGWTVVNCTDGDVPAKCAGFIESANPATVLALLDDLEAAESRIAELSHHLQCAHAFVEHTEAFGNAASNGILCCGDAQWNIDASKSALAAAGKGESS
ncbi:TPA: ead/Ea22-like family protein [Enterobacter cloacae]|nr:ead/Ea22-like family protein [Enterobacter cloacae]HAS1121158.1 ead/Ea22-like family protein [Enterobacter cloacae]HAS1134982.1 ead/Ea22-like family protein [Enterobacter cloacae]HCM9267551.1 ead/Ea22-like family protein [Enterobacter cloacae subsp. cloacae]HCM9539175.1 ead/Ea22-like family protein [Enterobacter cloacae subsp. cloacae]